MKQIKRKDLQKEYAKLVEDEPSFDPIYEAHGSHTECNFGGLVITLNNSGDACIVIRDWAGDTITISEEICEIDPVPIDPDDRFSEYTSGFYIDNIRKDEEPELLDNFMRI